MNRQKSTDHEHFTPSWGSAPWTDWNAIWGTECMRPRHNHPCQILCESVRGFSAATPPKVPFVERPLQQTVLHYGADCDGNWTDSPLSSQNLIATKVFRIGTVRYNCPMSAHASQAFSIAHCTDSEDLPIATLMTKICQHILSISIWHPQTIVFHYIQPFPAARRPLIIDRVEFSDIIAVRQRSKNAEHERRYLMMKI